MTTHPRLRNTLQSCIRGKQSDIVRLHANLVLLATETEQEVHREADIERLGRIDLVNLFVRQINSKGVNVALQVVDFAAADNGEDVWRYVVVSIALSIWNAVEHAHLCA